MVYWDSRKVSDTGKNWYLYKDANSVVYTPYTEGQSRFSSTSLNPEEASQQLHKDSEEGWEITWAIAPGVIRQTKKQNPLQEPVDIPPGFYRYQKFMGYPEEGFLPIGYREDTFLELDFSEIEKDISVFLDSEQIFKDLKIIYKKGFLLYGPPGNGKTSWVRSLIHKLIPKNAVCIFFSDDVPSDKICETLQNTMHDTLKVFIFEELALSTKYPERVAKLLNFLDGEYSVNNSITLATTNYPENIPGNLVNRPSRFDKLLFFDNPDQTSRTKLINFYLGQEPSEYMLKASEGFSIAAIKEICLNVRLLGTTFESEVKKLKERTALVGKAFSTKAYQPIGF